MDNKYKEYSNKDFKYSFPFKWKLRNKEYLKLRKDREFDEKKSNSKCGENNGN